MNELGQEKSTKTLTWLASLMGGVGWIILGAFVFVSVGMVTPFLGGLYQEATYHNVIFAVVASMIGVGLAHWRRGKKSAGTVGVIGLFAIGLAYVSDVYPTLATCQQAVEKQRKIISRQEAALHEWGVCFVSRESEACSTAIDETNDLSRLERSRRTLFDWWVENCSLPE